jgi:hypothetical protein
MQVQQHQLFCFQHQQKQPLPGQEALPPLAMPQPGWLMSGGLPAQPPWQPAALPMPLPLMLLPAQSALPLPPAPLPPFALPEHAPPSAHSRIVGHKRGRGAATGVAVTSGDGNGIPKQMDCNSIGESVGAYELAQAERDKGTPWHKITGLQDNRATLQRRKGLWLKFVELRDTSCKFDASPRAAAISKLEAMYEAAKERAAERREVLTLKGFMNGDSGELGWDKSDTGKRRRRAGDEGEGEVERLLDGDANGAAAQGGSAALPHGVSGAAAQGGTATAAQGSGHGRSRGRGRSGGRGGGRDGGGGRGRSSGRGGDRPHRAAAVFSHGPAANGDVPEFLVAGDVLHDPLAGAFFN